MKRFFTFAFAAAVTAGITATAWSQGGQGGGAGGAGGAGGSAGAGAGASSSAGAGALGTAGTAGNAGAAGTAGTAGTTGAAGSTGVSGAPTAAGAAGTRPNLRASGKAGVGVGQSRLGATGQGAFAFNGISQTPFFTDPGARQQLNLNDNQFNALNRAYQNAYSRYNQGITGLNNNLTDQQRMLEMQRLQAQFNQDFGTSLNTTFTDPRLRTRFDQLNRQFMGFNTFSDPAVRQQLNLTPEQMRQLRRLSNDWRRQLQQLRSGTTSGTAVNQQQWAQLWSQYGDQLNSVLTPTQQQAWAQLTGQAYTFSLNLYIPRNGTLPPFHGRSPDVNPVDPTTGIAPAGTARGTQNQTGTRQRQTQGSAAQGTQGGAVR